MTSIKVPHLSHIPVNDKQLTSHSIAFEPWNSASRSCSAEFQMAQLNDSIYLKFKVKEPFLKAKKRRYNEAVHFDNCVEFFFAFPGDSHYYNFEFNCLGSVKAAYGKSRSHRRYLPEAVLNQIGHDLDLSINNLYDERKIHWELSVILPMSAFPFHQYISFSGLQCTGNFTKCGEKLPKPHFMTWSNNLAEKPDFHRTDFFGKLEFENKP